MVNRADGIKTMARYRISAYYRTSLAVALSIAITAALMGCGGGPDNVARDDSQPVSTPGSDLLAAGKYYKDNDYENAAAAYRSFVDKNRGDKDVMFALYWEGISYLNLSNEHKSEKAAYMEKASKVFEEIIIEHSSDPTFENWGIRAATEMKKCHDWLAKYYFDLGLSYFEDKDYKDAKTQFNEASRFVNSDYFKDAQGYLEKCNNALSGKNN
jgi:outer membrane protein assembly factor BamD (BamD/ComL family)